MIRHQAANLLSPRKTRWGLDARRPWDFDMKVRWTSQSVRFRIAPEELAALVADHPIEETLSFPGGQWIARIVPTDRPTGLEPIGPFRDGMSANARVRGRDSVAVLNVGLSQSDIATLAGEDAEGVYFKQVGASPGRYYIEKDFPCVHPRPSKAEEPTDNTFPAPPGFEESKN